MLKDRLTLWTQALAPSAQGPRSSRDDERWRGAWARWRFLVWLALPFVFYLIPVFLGYSWNALSEGHNILNPPEAYFGRLPDQRITVESWGASVVDVPFHARLHVYLRTLQLPLWNPYQGLGQQFAAQGEENPYSPAAILRGALPYVRSNEITFGIFYLSGVCLYLFLRRLGLSEAAAIFGGTTWVVSGALSLQIGRPNIADQISLIPVLFWGAAKAISERSIVAYAIFAGAAVLHVLGGFIQIAMLSGVLVVIFCATYTRYTAESWLAWARDCAIVLGAFILGNGLAAFYLLPQLEAMVTTFNKDIPELALFVPIGLGNAVAFFFPLLLGFSLNKGWSPPPAVADWENLYAFAGTALLLITLFGLAVMRWPTPILRRWYWFFLIAGVGLTLRYVGAAPGRLVDYLPIISRQSPKHATGVMVFCFVVAASIAVNSVAAWNFRRGTWIGVGVCLYVLSVVAKLVDGAGYTSTRQVEIDWYQASRSFLATGYIAVLVFGTLWLVSKSTRVSVHGRIALLTAVTVAELLVYVPLGNAAFSFLAARLVLSTLLVAGGLLFVLGKRWAAGGTFALLLAGYGALIILPSVGLPIRENLEGPPRFLLWLKIAEGTAWRSFGIAPDHSSNGPVQDISVVGPLAPRDYAEFVKLIADDKTAHAYLASTTFMLAGPWNFGLDQYGLVKPITDWVGVRFLVLDKVYFNVKNRTDDVALLDGGSGMRIAYDDDRVRILESPAARTKAEFWTAADVQPDQASVLAELKAEPATILGPPKLEASDVPAAFAGLPTTSSNGPLLAPVQRYLANEVDVSADAPDRGVLVLKDVYSPGWQAYLNAATVPIVRVNGFARGVLIPQAGHYDVRFVYAPGSLVHGAWIALASAVFVVGMVVYSLVGGRRELPWWAAAVGAILVLAIVEQSLSAYFGTSVLAR